MESGFLFICDQQVSYVCDPKRKKATYYLNNKKFKNLIEVSVYIENNLDVQNCTLK
jgi:hypothetical protein